MFKKSSSSIVLSLSEDILKIVQVKGKGASAKLVNVVAENVKGLSDDGLVNTIGLGLKKFDLKDAEIIFALPPNLTTTKNIEIPSADSHEIQSIVALQAGRHTPFAREEIQVGYINQGTVKANFTKVLLVIANKTTLKNQISIFERAGLKINRVLFAPEAISRYYSDALKLGSASKPTALLNIDKQSTDFIIIQAGTALATRSIPIGRLQLANEGPAARERLIQEIGRTIDAYKNDDIGEQPSDYILTTDDNFSNELSTGLETKLQIKASVNSYVDHVKATGGVLQNMAASFADTSFLDAIAVAVLGNPEVDLMPEEVELQKSIEDQSRELQKTVLLGIGVFVVIVLIFVLNPFFYSQYYNHLQSGFKENRKEVSDLESQYTKTKLLQNFVGGRMSSLDAVQELYNSVPNEIYLTNVQMDEAGSVSIQGVSDIASLVFNLGTKLKESKLFKSVDIKSTTAKKDRGKDVSAFEITLKLASAVEDEAKPAEGEAVK